MMRLRLFFVCMLVFLGETAPRPHDMAVNAQETEIIGEVNVFRLNVRAAPTTESAIITQVNQGEVYPVLGRTRDFFWWLIELDDGTEGWVFSIYLTVADMDAVPIVESTGEAIESDADASEDAPPTTTADRVVLRITRDVNVRNGPSTAFDMVDGLVAESAIRAVGRNDAGTWVRIQRDFGFGWIIAGVLPAGYDVRELPVVTTPPDPRLPPTVLWQVSNFVYVYAGPGIFTPIIGELQAGARVRVLAQNETGQWVKVQAGEWGEGWVQAAVFPAIYDVTALPIAIR